MTPRLSHYPIALALAALLAGCGGGHSAPAADRDRTDAEARLAAADLAEVRTADLALGVPVSGTLTPGWEARLTAPLDEVLETVLVAEGERVGEGQPLARFRAEVVAAAAASAEAARRSAAADHDRFRELLRAGAVSAREVETVEAHWRAAEAQAAQAQRRLADATVRAPRAGVVSVRQVSSGDRVGYGDPMFTLVDTGVLEFEATVPSEDAAAVRPGAAVALTVSGAAAREVRGEVARVNATADPATRQVKVYVRVANRDGALVGGLYASGRVLSRRTDAALAVPTAAVHDEADTAWVMVLADGRLARRGIRIGLRDEGQGLVEVLAGLRAGEQVLTGPVEGLRDGQAARVGGKE
jgi:RND family efflux transporter MFP subunit